MPCLNTRWEWRFLSLKIARFDPLVSRSDGPEIQMLGFRRVHQKGARGLRIQRVCSLPESGTRFGAAVLRYTTVALRIFPNLCRVCQAKPLI